MIYFDFSGRERKITSEPIKVEVVGKPQVSPFKANFKQDFPLHSKAQVKTSFCSDPKPRSLKWQWGSLLLLEGINIFPTFLVFSCRCGQADLEETIILLFHIFATPLFLSTLKFH